MASVDVIRSCLDSIRQISDQIRDAVVYVDAGCLEAFRFIGAFPVLLEIGVRAICSLENMSPLDITVGWDSTFMGFTKKMAIITSRLLSDAHRYILRCLGGHRNILHCTIFTAISEIAHASYVDSPLGPDAFHEYESLLIQDYDELVIERRKGSSDNENKQSVEGEHDEKRPSEGDSCSQLASCDGYDLKVEPSCSEKLYDDDSVTRLQVYVHHFPMIICPLSPRVFVLPSEGIVAEARMSNEHEDSLSPGLPAICNGVSSDGEDVPPGVGLTAHFLYHLAAKMDLKMEIFSVGNTSRIIGKMLTDMSSLYDVGRRNRRSTGLLLIDRTLDLVTPCCHGDSFIDRILSSLPRMDRTTSSLPAKSSEKQSKTCPVNVQRAPLDVKVVSIGKKEEPSMQQLSKSIQGFMSGWNCELDDEVDINTCSCDGLLNASFLSNCLGTSSYLEALLDKGAKDGADLIKSWLLEALQHDDDKVLPLNTQGLTTAQELHDLVKTLAPNSISLLRNRGIIQLALAAEIALGDSRWDALVSAERILSVGCTDTSQSLSNQIRDLINTSNLSQQGLVSFRDVVLLSMIGYIMGGENFPTSVSNGPFSWEEEQSLKAAIIDTILENPQHANLQFLGGGIEKGDFVKHEDDFDDQWGSWDDEENENENGLKLLGNKVDRLFKVFHKLSSLKWISPSLRDGLIASGNFPSDAYNRKGLLYKLLISALGKYDIPGLEYHSSAVGRFFKSGLGRFGLGQAKPSFGDQDLLLVFVVGGINTLEVREIMEAVSEYARPDSELILGATTLLTPHDMLELLLGSSSYI